MVDERFTKADRLLRRRDFILVGRYGKRFSTRGLILLVKRNKAVITGRPRLGITAGRKVGKAHDRNRIKRLCREYFRRNKHRFQPGHDYVVIIRTNHGIACLSDLEAHLDNLLSDQR